MDKVTDQDVYDVAEKPENRIDPTPIVSIANRWCASRLIKVEYEAMQHAIHEKTLHQLSRNHTLNYMELRLMYFDPTVPDEIHKAFNHGFAGNTFHMVDYTKAVRFRLGVRAVDQIGGGQFYFDENCEPVIVDG